MFSSTYRHRESQFHSISFQNFGPLRLASRDGTGPAVGCRALDSASDLATAKAGPAMRSSNIESSSLYQSQHPRSFRGRVVSAAYPESPHPFAWGRSELCQTRCKDRLPRIKTTAVADVKQLTAEEFMAKHQSKLAENDEKIGPPPASISQKATWNHYDAELSAWFHALPHTYTYRIISELKQWWLVRLLGAAKKESSPEAYRELLEGFLIRLDVEAPEGVFIPHRRSPGAPPKKSTEEIYRTWIEKGKPGWSSLAYFVSGQDYTAADANQRKKLRDRYRRAVARHQKRLATKSVRN